MPDVRAVGHVAVRGQPARARWRRLRCGSGGQSGPVGWASGRVWRSRIDYRYKMQVRPLKQLVVAWMSWWAGGKKVAGSRAMPRQRVLRGGEIAAVRLSSETPPLEGRPSRHGHLRRSPTLGGETGQWALRAPPAVKAALSENEANYVGERGWYEHARSRSRSRGQVLEPPPWMIPSAAPGCLRPAGLCRCRLPSRDPARAR